MFRSFLLTSLEGEFWRAIGFGGFLASEGVLVVSEGLSGFCCLVGGGDSLCILILLGLEAGMGWERLSGGLNFIFEFVL